MSWGIIRCDAEQTWFSMVTCRFVIRLQSIYWPSNLDHQTWNVSKYWNNGFPIVRHKGVVRLYGYFWDERRVFLVLEFAPGVGVLPGSLRHYWLTFIFPTRIHSTQMVYNGIYFVFAWSLGRAQKAPAKPTDGSLPRSQSCSRTYMQNAMTSLDVSL